MITLWQGDQYPDTWVKVQAKGLVLTYAVAPVLPTVPIEDNEVEILYSIPISAKSNTLVFRQDSLVWDVVQKSATKWRHEYTTLRFRIRDIYIDAFYQFHVDNRASIVSLTTTGLTPFIRPAETNSVYIIPGFSRPTLEKPKYYIMSVTYLNIETEA